jgi:hydrogenase maturation protease
MARVLVAGIGNVFLGDDGFGVAVAQRMARERLPDGTTVTDYGIRALHLAFALLSSPELDLLVLVDATSRDEPPGTLYLIDPAVEEASGGPPANAHAMSPEAVLVAVRQMGGSLPRTRIVGCEPADLGEGMRLSDPVTRAIEPAIAMIRRLIESESASESEGRTSCAQS